MKGVLVLMENKVYQCTDIMLCLRQERLGFVQIHWGPPRGGGQEEGKINLRGPRGGGSQEEGRLDVVSNLRQQHLSAHALVAASCPGNVCPPSRPTGYGVHAPEGQDIAQKSPNQAAGGVAAAVRSSEGQDVGHDAAGSDALGLHGIMRLGLEGKAANEGKRVRLQTLIQTSQGFRHPTSQREQYCHRYMFEALRHSQTPSIRQDQNGIDVGRQRGTREEGKGGNCEVGCKGANGHGGAVVGARSNSTCAQVLGALAHPSTRIFGYYPQREIVKSPVIHEQPATSFIHTQQSVIEHITTASSNQVLKSNMASRLPHSSSASVAARLPACTSSSSSIEDDRGGGGGGSVQKTLNNGREGIFVSSGGVDHVVPARDVVPAREVGLGGGSGATMSVALSSAFAATTSSNERTSEGARLLPPQASMSPPPPPPLSSLACQTPERGHGPTQMGKEKIQVFDVDATNVVDRCRPVSSGHMTHSLTQEIVWPQSALGRPICVPTLVLGRKEESDKETNRAVDDRRGIDKDGGVGVGGGHANGAGGRDRAQMFFHSYGRPDTFARTPRNRIREQQQERERAIGGLMAQGQQ